MRYLTIPKPIHLLDNDDRRFKRLNPDKTQPTPQEIQMGAQVHYCDQEARTFWSWIKTFVLRDKKFNEGFETWERVARIKAAVKGIEVGKLIILDEDDWKLLVEVIKTPTQSYYQDGTVAEQLMPFIILVVGASGKKPNKSKRAAAANVDGDDEFAEEAAA